MIYNIKYLNDKYCPLSKTNVKCSKHSDHFKKLMNFNNTTHG